MATAETASVRSVVVSSGPFNGCKVFSATMVQQRDQLGEVVTEWLAAHRHVRLREIVVTQSSDAQFHCVALTVFYFEPPATPTTTPTTTPPTNDTPKPRRRLSV